MFLVGSSFGPWPDGLWALCQSACAEARGEPVLVLGSSGWLPYCRGVALDKALAVAFLSCDVSYHFVKGERPLQLFCVHLFWLSLGLSFSLVFVRSYHPCSVALFSLFFASRWDFSISPVSVQLGTS